MAKLEECQLLVEAGANLDSMAARGSTPFDICFAFPPDGMLKPEGGLGPTKEMIRRYKDKRNACALYLRGKGARSGMFEIRRAQTLPDFLVPFPERWHESRMQGHVSDRACDSGFEITAADRIRYRQWDAGGRVSNNGLCSWRLNDIERAIAGGRADSPIDEID